VRVGLRHNTSVCALRAQVSVSALQWLAAAGDSPGGAAAAAARCAVFFRSLAAALSPGAAAALQVYPACDAEAATLTAAAAAAGFPRPLLVADMTHATPARKLFLCVRKPPLAAAQPALLLPVGAADAPPDAACALAWPRRAACACAWWDAHSSQAGRTFCDDGGQVLAEERHAQAAAAARERLAEEHAKCAMQAGCEQSWQRGLSARVLFSRC
jgi:hypothetical protein